MVKNKGELVAAADEWLGIAREDISNQMRAFMTSTGATIEQVADILDCDVEMVAGMLNGTINIDLATFAKLLIATGNVIVITPESQMGGQGMMPGGMPPMQRGGHMRPTTRRQMPPRGANGRFTRPTPPAGMGGYNMGLPPTGAPQMPPRGAAAPFGYGMPPQQGVPGGFELPAGVAVPPVGAMQEPVALVAPADAQQDVVDADALAQTLANALRTNPEAANVLRNILGNVGE